MFHTNNFTAMSRRAIALLTAAVTLSSIALIGVPAAAADEQQATAEQNTAAKPSVIINEVYAGNTKLPETRIASVAIGSSSRTAPTSTLPTVPGIGAKPTITVRTTACL